MVYIFGKLLDKKKSVHYGLGLIYGLGLFQIKVICNYSNIGFDCKISELSQAQIINICKKIDKQNLFIESFLRNMIKTEIKRLIMIKSFRGFFHEKKKKKENVGKK